MCLVCPNRIRVCILGNLRNIVKRYDYVWLKSISTNNCSMLCKFETSLLHVYMCQWQTNADTVALRFAGERTHPFNVADALLLGRVCDGASALLTVSRQ